jgi:putative ABC transport system permease protein
LNLIQLFKLAHSYLFANLSRYLWFVISLSLGLIGLQLVMAIDSSIQTRLKANTKNLLGAELTIGARRLFSSKENELISQSLERQLKEKTSSIELFSMLENKLSKHARLVEVVAAGDNYPLNGDFKLKDKTNNSTINQLKDQHIWVSQAIFDELDLKENQTVSLAGINFKLAGIIETDSTLSWRAISLAPRVYIKLADLNENVFLNRGATVYQRYFYNLQNQSELTEIETDLNLLLNDPAIKVTQAANANDQIARVTSLLTDYLGLVSLVALFLASIGCIYLFRSQLLLLITDVAILKSLGLSGSKVSFLMLIKVFSLASLSFLIALLSTYLIFPIVQTYLETNFSFQLNYHFNFKIIIFLFLVAVLNALLVQWPQVRLLSQASSGSLFSDNNLNEVKSLNTNLFYYFPAMLLFWGVCIYLAQSIKIGSVFFASFLLSSFLLFILVKTLINRLNLFWLKRPIYKLTHRLWLLSAIRNSTSTTISFIAIGLSALLINFIFMLEIGLIKELDISGKQNAPSLFLFDIQEDQLDAARDLIKNEGSQLDNISPMIQARLISINDEAFKRVEKKSFETREDQSARNISNRTINLSFKNQLNPSEKLIAGYHPDHPFDGAKDKLACISLEKRYARRLNIKLQDKLKFDVLGIAVEGEVCSFREVKWTSFLPNFFVLFQTGVLEDAPKTYLASIIEHDKSKRLVLIRTLAREFSNIAVIDTISTLAKVKDVMTSAAFTIKLMALFCLVIGLLVVFSIAQEMLVRSVDDYALLDLLGMNNDTIRSNVTSEFVMISFFASFLGALISILLLKTISFSFFDGILVFDWVVFLATIVLIPLICSFMVIVRFNFLRVKRGVLC